PPFCSCLTPPCRRLAGTLAATAAIAAAPAAAIVAAPAAAPAASISSRFAPLPLGGALDLLVQAEADMDGSCSSSGLFRRKGKVDLPLIVCTDCKCRTVLALKAKTEANYGKYFYMCPAHKRDGTGCPFWYWEEDYEAFLMEKGYLPASYQPVFKKNTWAIQRMTEEAKRKGQVMKNREFAEEDYEDKIDKLIAMARIMVLLLKCLLAVCVLGLLTNMYQLFRSA
ncbi:unnamed protein product, partial [Urochloa humidicola]